MFKRVFFYRLDRIMTGKVGPKLRALGQSYYKKGMELQGEHAHEDTIVPSMRSIPLSDTVYPKMLEADWVAPNATVVGDVQVGEGSSLWHGAVVRGDTAQVEIGKNTIIHDRVQISNSKKDNSTLTIGDSVFIGSNAKIDGAELENFAYVGSGANVGQGVVVEGYGMVAAGSNVTPGTVIESGQVYAGSPAKYLRDLTQEEKHMISEFKEEQQQMARVYNEETEKTFREQADDFDRHLWEILAEPTEIVAAKLSSDGLPVFQKDFEHIEHRTLNDWYTGPEVLSKGYHRDADLAGKGWNPYEQDLSLYPEIYKMYGENFDRFERAKKKFEDEKPGEQQAEPPTARNYPTNTDPWTKRYDDFMPRFNGGQSN